MGNNYTREDSIESQGRQSRSSSILRRYRSFRHKDSTSLSRCSTTEDQDDSEREATSTDNREEGEAREPPDLMALEEAERQKPPKMLTEAQKETIKRTWKIIETNVARVGVVTFIGLFETHPDVQEVFIPFRGLPMEEVQQSKELRSHALRLFETHPDVQEVFIPFRGLPMEEVQQSKELRSHALRVMGFVEKAVRRLEEPEKLVPLIQECGKNHCHYGAQIQHVELVGPEFLKAIQPALESEWTDEVEEAWDLLMKNIAYGMRLAMIEEIKKG